MYKYSYTENPPNCVGGIREFILCLLIASLVLALLLNTSCSCSLLRIICLVSTISSFLMLTIWRKREGAAILDVSAGWGG
jgi:hypothetical protein